MVQKSRRGDSQRLSAASTAARNRPERAYTSREAALVSGVPFFTIDYWSRTRVLTPTIAKGTGRGKGRQRMYSYGDILRLRIARELRDQKVSLETLRAIIKKLAGVADELAGTRFVWIDDKVEMARSTAELMTLLRRPGRSTFGILLDLRTLLQTVRERARGLAAGSLTDDPE
jgi:DNA-binding transcriptional MerR regulator